MLRRSPSLRRTNARTVRAKPLCEPTWTLD
jgi:hypothetical protein